MNSTLDLLARRRSLPPNGLGAPGPNAEELSLMLKLASRVPDHGKLAPWRFVVIEDEARAKLGRLALDTKLCATPDLDAAAQAAELGRFTRAPLVIAVVSRSAPHVKIPEWEQVLSAGAVCMTLVVAANALGFGSTWLTEWCAYDPAFRAGFGLAEHERIAGFIHVGRPAYDPEDRARPALESIVTRYA